jgi:hypothetical protein
LLTEFRISLLEIVTALASHSTESWGLMSLALWRVLANWFLEHSSSTIYLVAISRFIVRAINDKHEESLRNLFVKNKFLSRMMAHFKSDPRDGMCVCVHFNRMSTMM